MGWWAEECPPRDRHVLFPRTCEYTLRGKECCGCDVKVPSSEDRGGSGWTLEAIPFVLVMAGGGGHIQAHTQGRRCEGGTETLKV